MREEQDIDPASHHQQLEDNTQEAIIFRSRNHRKQSRPCYHMHFPLETPSRLTTSDQASWSALVLAPESLCPWTPPPQANWDGCSLPQRRDSNSNDDLRGESKGQRPGRPRRLGFMEQHNWEQGSKQRSFQKFAENPLESPTDPSLCLCVDLFKLLATRVERQLCKHSAFSGDLRKGHTLEVRWCCHRVLTHPERAYKPASKGQRSGSWARGEHLGV